MLTKQTKLDSRIILSILALSLSPLTHSASYPKTDQDFFHLPAYCKAKLKPSKKGESALWLKRLGKDFRHTHHYCAALHTYRQAQRMPSSKPEKTWSLRGVISEIEYMEKHANPKYILFPEIYTLKGKVFSELNEQSQAIVYFKKAIQANSKYQKAYIALADFYNRTNNTDKAILVIKQGLKIIPNSKALMRRLKKMNRNK